MSEVSTGAIKGSNSLSEESRDAITSTKDLKRVLGRKELLAIAIGETIGAGVFALTGVVIGISDRSVVLCFLLSAILVMITAVPYIFAGGTVRLRGGQYTQAALFFGKKFAGIYIIIFLLSNVAMAIYAISFAEYLVSLIPALAGYTKLLALGVLTIIYVVNLLGVQTAAFWEKVMVLLMSVALTVFIVLGIGDVQPGYFQQPGWITGGVMGVLMGTALMQYAISGAYGVINFGAEAKNPTKDIPFVIIVSTLLVTLVYILVGFVAAGVLPLEQVGGQPLTAVATAIMPTWLLYFFVICGAGFALTTTLNAMLSWVTNRCCKRPSTDGSPNGWAPSIRNTARRTFG